MVTSWNIPTIGAYTFWEIFSFGFKGIAVMFSRGCTARLLANSWTKALSSERFTIFPY